MSERAYGRVAAWACAALLASGAAARAETAALVPPQALPVSDDLPPIPEDMLPVPGGTFTMGADARSAAR